MKYDKLIALLENGATAVNFDLHISDELYVRTRVERMSSCVKAFYFVRSGDMGEQSEGVCPFDGYDRFLTELADVLRRESEDAVPTATVHRLNIGDSEDTQSLSEATLTDVMETLSAYAPDLALLDNFKPYV